MGNQAWGSRLGDLGERREKRSQALLVRLQRDAVAARSAAFEKGIGVDRITQAMRGLWGVTSWSWITDPRRSRVDIVTPAVETEVSLHALHQRTQELGARHQREIRLAVGDTLAGDIDGLLRAVAPRLGVDTNAARPIGRAPAEAGGFFNRGSGSFESPPGASMSKATTAKASSDAKTVSGSPASRTARSAATSAVREATENWRPRLDR